MPVRLTWLQTISSRFKSGAYEFVAQLVEFGDPALEAFANYARLLRKRLKGITLEQVDLDALTLTHLKASKGGTLTGISGEEEKRWSQGIGQLDK